jgi:acetyltransferase-like isoleucine patch superfamily enzyme
LSGTTICAVTSVSIGQRVLLGADVLIADTDFHVVDRLPRRFDAIPMARPDDAVVIEDDVFVGARAIVLKGVRIGHGSVIGAGSLVTEDVPPNVVAAGSPCKPIRSLRLQS